MSLIIKQEIANTTEVLCEQISARLKVRKMKREKSKSLSTSSVCTDGARLDIAAFGVQGMRKLSLMLRFLTPLPL